MLVPKQMSLLWDMAEQPGHSWKCLRLKSILSHHFGRLRAWFPYMSTFPFCYQHCKRGCRSTVMWLAYIPSIGSRSTSKSSMPNNGKQKQIIWDANRYALRWKVILWLLVWVVILFLGGGWGGNSTYKTWKNCKVTACDTLLWLCLAQLLKTLGKMLQRLLQPFLVLLEKERKGLCEHHLILSWQSKERQRQKKNEKKKS